MVEDLRKIFYHLFDSIIIIQSNKGILRTRLGFWVKSARETSQLWLSADDDGVHVVASWKKAVAAYDDKQMDSFLIAAFLIFVSSLA